MYRKILKSFLICLTMAALLCTSAFAVTIGGGTVTGSGVRLRTSPDTSSASNIVKELDRNEFLLVEETLPGWYKVASGGVTGYVSADYVSFAETADGSYPYAGAATVGTCINLRAEASVASAVVKNLAARGTALTIRGVSGAWLKVTAPAGAAGYIRSDLVNYGTAGTAAAPVAAGNATGAQIAETAKTYLGSRYVYGGASPATGFDCSGFVNYIYELYGYDLNRVAQDIYAGDGRAVSKAELQPGDVLCFGWGPYSVTHVGIYIGGGQMVHASTYSTGVITSDINSNYYTARYVGAKRIVA